MYNNYCTHLFNINVYFKFELRNRCESQKLFEPNKMLGNCNLQLLHIPTNLTFPKTQSKKTLYLILFKHLTLADTNIIYCRTYYVPTYFLHPTYSSFIIYCHRIVSNFVTDFGRNITHTLLLYNTFECTLSLSKYTYKSIMYL